MWTDTFDEKREYLDYFFDNVFDDETTFIYRENNKIVASLYGIPYKIKCDENNSIKDVLYLYALATDKDYRKRGIMTRLLEEAYEYSKKKAFSGCILIPANESLFDFYKSRGYVKISSFRSYIINSSEWNKIIKKINLEVVSGSEYGQIIRKILNDNGNIPANDKVTETLVKCYQEYDVKIYRGDSGYVIADSGDNEVNVFYSDIRINEYSEKIEKHVYFKSEKNDIQYIKGAEFLLQ